MNVFSVDLEDWYQGLELPYESWHKYSNRILKGLDPLLELLSDHSTKATFFTLGWIGEKHPELLARLSKEGHEIASHGYSHEKVYELTPKQFREDIRKTKKILEEHSGAPVTAYRAPFFSITKDSLWALDVLAEEGYVIDCSISPVKTWRYGIATVPDEIFTIKENGITEFPASAVKILSKHIGIGGAYFRLFPYILTKRGLNSRSNKGKANMFYVHPWEYDVDHPVVKIERKAQFTHYTRLNKTCSFTKKLLEQFEFSTVSRVVEQYKNRYTANEYGIEILKD